MKQQEYTIAIIKPKALKPYGGHIIEQIQAKGYTIAYSLYLKLKLAEAEEFYAVHKERPFYNDLCAYISSGDIIAMELRKENAVVDFRAFIGATDPAQAAQGTLRKQFGRSIAYNAVHGSDSIENAKKENAFFGRFIN